MKPVVLFILVGLISAGTNAQEKIEWSPSQKITVSDFKGPAPDPKTKQTLIAHTGIESKLTGPDIKLLKNFNPQVANYFFPGDSWILASDKTRITYFQALFDMNEWMARELRKRCKENRKVVLAGQYELIYAQLAGEFAQIREQYDQETDYGYDKAKQQAWEKKIAERISDLSDFCRTCGKKN